MKNRKQMHANEWRNWLWYCAPICLHRLFPSSQVEHLERLSHASYLLALDIISQEDIDQAEQLIDEYFRLYDNFGIEKTRRNLHNLRHAPNTVRRWGPLWCYSTFNFESWNHLIMLLITSPKGALQQIVTRHLIRMNIELAMHSSDLVSEEVREATKKIVNEARHVLAFQVDDKTYLLGASTQKQHKRNCVFCSWKDSTHRT